MATYLLYQSLFKLIVECEYKQFLQAVIAYKTGKETAQDLQINYK